MLVICGSFLLLFSACAILYQADKRRSTFPSVKGSANLRTILRTAACGLLVLSLCLMAELQGWERGIAVWLAALTFVFVGGLFLAAVKPQWHGTTGLITLVAGLLLSVGGLTV